MDKEDSDREVHKDMEIRTERFQWTDKQVLTDKTHQHAPLSVGSMSLELRGLQLHIWAYDVHHDITLPFWLLNFLVEKVRIRKMERWMDRYLPTSSQIKWYSFLPMGRRGKERLLLDIVANIDWSYKHSIKDTMHLDHFFLNQFSCITEFLNNCSEMPLITTQYKLTQHGLCIILNS